MLDDSIKNNIAFGLYTDQIDDKLLDQAISKGLAYAPYSDLIWCETATPNLEEAIPILEKWFDDLQSEKSQNILVKEQVVEKNHENNPKNDVVDSITKENNDVVSAAPISEASNQTMKGDIKGVTISMLDKLKNLKFSKAI